MIVIMNDQPLWYIDLTVFAFTRKFPIGVAKYITWPTTTKLRLLTTFHHVWFLPLGLWSIAPSAPGFTLKVYGISCVMVLILAIIGRLSTPKEVKYYGDK